MAQFKNAQEALFWASNIERAHETGQPRRAKEESVGRPCSYEHVFHIMKKLRFDNCITPSEYLTVKFFSRIGRHPDRARYGRAHKPHDERRAFTNWERAMPIIATALMVEGIVEVPDMAIKAAA